MGVVVVTGPGPRAAFDAGRAIQNMMLAAWADGVGSCIAALHDKDRARDILDVPAELGVEYAISFGYPDPDAPATIEGRPREEVLAQLGRRPLEQILHQEKW
jgi:nitroreductase